MDIQAEEIDITDLESNLDIAYLDKIGTDDWNLTPRELIRKPEKEPGHYEKVKNAKMKYPIEIFFFKNHWRILDVVHRFCKAIMENQKNN